MKTVKNRGVTEIYQAEPILIERTRHSHRPNVMFSFGTAPSERGMRDIKYSIILISAFLFLGCNERTTNTMDKQIRMDESEKKIEYTRDSAFLEGGEPFSNSKCASELSRIIEKNIIDEISENRYDSIKGESRIWARITFRVSGEVLDITIFPKTIPRKERLRIEEKIVQNKLNLNCSALKNKTCPKEKIIMWVLPIPCDW